MAKTATKTVEKEAKPTKQATKAESAVAAKLEALYRLQHFDSLVDKIRTERGELPLEVQDLEDEVAGLETRMNKLSEALKAAEKAVSDKQNFIKEAKASIKNYEAQQSKVRNNREYDSLSKEIEFQNLEIQLAEKRIKEGKVAMESKSAAVEESKQLFKDRKKDLDIKRKELDDIIAETEKEERSLVKKSEAAAGEVEERLLKAYHRIRGNARNGLAVVHMERGSCGGCFNAIPPQRQLDIASHKKIIVCEHCGRILVDESIVDEVAGKNK
ncbi:MAG TPA: C4-type zinc ribbon domain-containing protein [Flavobacteriales bacterium]|nr:C4-type zinc ribbon domain-containing protein [Flavobacteriales bacterium]HRN35912.1 C4-type zinc ribbon domain-containing protein [Flavobacteriales bacterium]HRO38926.1 C4-type zinc ribbon domain-containing protein [Flavobacteriales bacterium]HRP80271.1 C4-type zinc ribbon domain-containing protein [Flavobacteriales bacterium]HRQ83679.1 C4-type zinc ribbon domain-containing protein [Flavobacteriales bacterium]